MPDPVTFAVHNQVGVITMNRPQALNAISLEMIGLFSEHLRQAASAQVRALLITGSGAAFCVGADVKELAGWGSNPGLREQFCVEASAMFHSLGRYPCPVIAVVNGVAAAGGFELCCMADIVLAADEAMIGDAHANFVGFGPVSAAMAARRLPPHKAAELLYTGDLWSATEMERFGFVNRTAPAGQLLDLAHTMAAQIASKQPLALREAKTLMRLSHGVELETLLEDGFRRAQSIFNTRDFAEGVQAFAEKRPPVFEGR